MNVCACVRMSVKLCETGGLGPCPPSVLRKGGGGGFKVEGEGGYKGGGAWFGQNRLR